MQDHTRRAARQNRRAQAALEFIMTYGWAILVVMVMIGALAYMGVANPKKLIPESCTMTTGFHCQDFRVTATPGGLQVQFAMQNKQGEQVKIIPGNIVSSHEGGNGPCQASGTTGNLTLDADGVGSFVCFTAFGNPGSRQPVKISINFTYITGTGIYEHPLQGQISTAVN